MQQANGRSQDGSFANLRAQQEQKQRQTTRSGTQKQNKRPVAETSSAALARLNYEEAKARRMAAEADLARLEEGLKARKAPAEKDAKLSPPRLRESRTSGASSMYKAPPRPHPSKISSLFHNFILGLNVQARTWEAPTSDALALKQARRALGDYRFNEMRKSKAMADLLDEVHARGGDSKDAIRVLEDYVNRKISKEEAEKKMEALKAEKKKDGKELSLAEREELVRLDIKHNQLMLQKLVSHHHSRTLHLELSDGHTFLPATGEAGTSTKRNGRAAKEDSRCRLTCCTDEDGETCRDSVATL